MEKDVKSDMKNINLKNVIPVIIYVGVVQATILTFLKGHFITIERGTRAGVLQHIIGMAIIIGIFAVIGALYLFIRRYLKNKRSEVTQCVQNHEKVSKAEKIFYLSIGAGMMSGTLFQFFLYHELCLNPLGRAVAYLTAVFTSIILFVVIAKLFKLHY